MKNWKLFFLEKTVLGRKTNLTNSDVVLSKCIELAYKDMMNAGRYYSKYFKYTNEDICSRTKEIINKNTFTFSRKLISEVSLFFEDDEIIRMGNQYVTRYGLAQKLVNMAFKYLYIFSDYIFTTEVSSQFSNCDCPLDSIILGKANINDYVWSKITQNQYIQCQDKISNLLKAENVDPELEKLGNLAYDFLSW